MNQMPPAAPSSPVVAYFSMEIGLDAALPTYSGGLGVLAGDTLRSAADLGLPMVGITLVHRRGYFRQRLEPDGSQREEPEAWDVEKRLEPTGARARIEIEGRRVTVRAWRYRIRGSDDESRGVPVYLLDTDLPENAPGDRRLTDTLYGGDPRYRLCQEAILGLGGVAMLRALGHVPVHRYHLNEGHAALVVLALLQDRLAGAGDDPAPRERALEEIRSRCVFTTHTPVPAGHDRFPGDLVRGVLGDARAERLERCVGSDELNMTALALEGAGYVNGVAGTHGRVSRGMFPGYPIRSITNGVHLRTWAAPSIAALFDRYLPDWRHDAFALRYAAEIPAEAIWAAHGEAKRALLARVERETGWRPDPDVLTIGFARRATPYKRGTLVFHDPERLRSIVSRHGRLQLVYAGKAHPADAEGKEIIRAVHRMRNVLPEPVSVSYLPDYDMELGRILCAGSDVWLNTPVPPLEASGTSGMKAALNGVPSLSVLDGWWVEGYAPGLTGWAFGPAPTGAGGPTERDDERDADSLYAVLEESVLPTFYDQPERFVEMMRHAIALNGSFFNTERMLWQYVHDSYGLHRAAGPRVRSRGVLVGS